MVEGQVFLKGGGADTSYFIFSRFIIFTFRSYFTLCRNCYAFEKKKNFCHNISMKKGHSKLSKNELENIP